jgi:hypothetical protein
MSLTSAAFCPIQFNTLTLNPQLEKIARYVFATLLVVFGLFIGLAGRKFYTLFVFLLGFVNTQILFMWIYYSFVL